MAHPDDPDPREMTEAVKQRDLQMLLRILRQHRDLDLEEAVDMLEAGGPDYTALLVDPPAEETPWTAEEQQLVDDTGRAEGRELTDQEAYLVIHQARAIGEIAGEADRRVMAPLRPPPRSPASESLKARGFRVIEGAGKGFVLPLAGPRPKP
jgi:hypothetical protein